MDKEFYELHKGIRCPNEIFTKDVRKVKKVLDYAMEKYDRSISLVDLESLFYTSNKTLTTSNKEQYQKIFQKIANTNALNKDVASDVISKLFQQVVGEEVANIGYAFVNGTENSLEPLRKIVEKYKDDFTPNIKIKYENMELDSIWEDNEDETQWKFNIPTLQRRVEGVTGGHFVIVGARPNTGKTSFHASIIASEGGFAEQGAKCLVLCNEEASEVVRLRYSLAGTGIEEDEIRKNLAKSLLIYNRVKPNIDLIDGTGEEMPWVEAVVKSHRPDIVILDMGHKYAERTSDKTDVYLKDAAIHARNIAKQYNCVVFWMTQLSASAEGQVNPDMSMIEGSKTGLAGEADLMILISKNRKVEGADESEDSQRHLTIAKNKISGFHGRVTCQLDGLVARYTA